MNKKLISDTTDSMSEFVTGDGEMATLTRRFDWTSSSIGPAASWPQSLRTTLSIILNSRFPMFLFWGPNLICFYNDAYRPSLGKDGKHPHILGMKAEDAWPEIWSIIKPLIDQVLATGEATWSEDQLIPIYRNAKIEDVYWTFSYSPVINESGKPGGVFVTCFETTEKVINIKKLKESNEELNFAIEAPELATWDYHPQTKKFTGNDRWRNWIGVEHTGEIELSDVLHFVIEKDRDRVTDSISQALHDKSGGFYDEEYTLVNPITKEERMVHSKGRAWFNEEKIPIRLNGIIQDVTKIKKTQLQLEKYARYLQVATDSANVGTWSLDIESGALTWSNLHKKMWGYEKNQKDLTYEDWHKIILPEDKEMAFEKVEEARLKRVLYEVQYRIRKADDNTIHWMRSLGKFFYNDKGEAETLTGISIDISKQKEDEDELRRSQETLLEREELFRTMAETLPQMIWIINGLGVVEYASRSWEKYSGIANINEAWNAMMHPEEKDAVMKAWKRDMDAGNPFRYQMRLKNKFGEYRWHFSAAETIKDEKGKVIKWIGSLTDIHEQKMKEQQKDEFISIASHEMKTPLTTAKGYLELLQLSLPTSKPEYLYVSKANQAIARLQDFINDLLDAGKIQNGKLNYNITRFNFNDLLEESVETVQHNTSTHIIRKADTVLSEINGDKNRLQQVIVNLLLNAIKYSPNANEIIVRILRDENYLTVSVQDFGVGMAKEHLDKIFDRYYRVEEHAFRFQGLGIGLYISKDIVERHRGKMWAESEEEKGSIFYFTLPL
ncbi:MAG: PAS domain-containing protein [Bacteroidetes bacterium]|nr:PAS domain-containing protein [Bacteroidota bacterium]